VDDQLRLDEGQVEWRRTGANTILVVDRRNGDEFEVNRAGSDLWEALCTGSTEVELAGLLRARYDLDQVTAVRDVTTFLSVLSDRGLLTR
jgi:hypothetical protein